MCILGTLRLFNFNINKAMVVVEFTRKGLIFTCLCDDLIFFIKYCLNETGQTYLTALYHMNYQCLTIIQAESYYNIYLNSDFKL